MRIINRKDRKPVADTYCKNLKAPEQKRACNRLPCVTYRWESNQDWQTCNETCGNTGYQRRHMACNKYFGDDLMSAVAHKYCGEDMIATETRECNRHQCYNIKWVLTQDWGTCSQTCGSGGIQEKVVICKNITYDEREITLPNTFCEHTPITLIQQSCQFGDCVDQYMWDKTSVWSKCSVTCGQGRQQMKHQCTKMDGDASVVVGDPNCIHLAVDNVTRICDAGPCGYLEWGAGSWSSVSKQSFVQLFL